MSTETSRLDAMLAQYDKNTSSTNESKAKFDLKNYFSTFLDKKEKTAIRRIRILPSNDNGTPFKEMHGHKIQVEGEWKTFACLKTEKNSACPFCEAREALLATGRESDKETAKTYGSRKLYIVKVIDRDNEDHGVKFWRFNHDYRKTGTLDKIFSIINSLKVDISDAVNGRDLSITLARDQNNKTVIQSILPMDKSPLSTDETLLAEWLEDERTWHDVYSIKSYDYLEIIVKGGVPAWDKVQEKYVDKASLKEEGDNVDDELTVGVENVKKNIQTASAPSVSTAKAEMAEIEDDLPF